MFSFCRSFPRSLLTILAVVHFVFPAMAQEETIKVGVLHSLSGTMAISETTLKNTMLFLIDEQNKKGGLLGKKLEAVVVDPASDWPLFAEKARELIAVNKVAAVFGCWTSVSRKSVLPVFEELNSLLFYPVQYEGEESQRNVFYTGAAPNQQAIPAVDYLMSEEGGSVKRWVLAGTDYVYPQTTNKILQAYLESKGVAKEDIMINYTPFGHSDWQTIVTDIKNFGSAGKKTAVVSTINGDANVPFYKELGNQGIKAEDIPVVALSLTEEDLARLVRAPFVGQYVAASYFQSVDNPTNVEFIEKWRAFIKDDKRVTSDPMEATFIGFNMWVDAVKKAGTVNPDAVIDAIVGVSVPNLTGGFSTMMPNHHITKPAFVGRIQADGPVEAVWQNPGLIVGDSWSDYLPESKDLISDWSASISCGGFNSDDGRRCNSGEELATLIADDRVVSLLFTTTRKPNIQPGEVVLGNERASQLSFGAAQVRIPDEHEFGNVERFSPSWFDRLLRREADPRRHFELLPLQLLSESEFDAAISAHTSDDVLIFVHGFNNDFEAGAFRLAQIVWDTKYQGIPILFSWASAGSALDYVKDQDSAQLSVDGFVKLLCQIRSSFPKKKIDVVGHSMGGQIVMMALRRDDCPMQLDQVVLAAPDVDRDIFISAAERARNKASGLTVYASSRDAAMAISRGIRHGSPRVGDVLNNIPVITKQDVDFVDTIDVSSLGNEFLGLNHNTFSASMSVADDLARLIADGLRPPSRRTPIIVGVPSSDMAAFFKFPN